MIVDLGSDGTGYEAIIRPGGGARNPITPASLELKDCEDGASPANTMARFIRPQVIRARAVDIA